MNHFFEFVNVEMNECKLGCSLFFKSPRGD